MLSLWGNKSDPTKNERKFCGKKGEENFVLGVDRASPFASLALREKWRNDGTAKNACFLKKKGGFSTLLTAGKEVGREFK